MIVKIDISENQFLCICSVRIIVHSYLVLFICEMAHHAPVEKTVFSVTTISSDSLITTWYLQISKPLETALMEKSTFPQHNL